MTSKPFQIPWKFLIDSDEPRIVPKSQLDTKPISNKTFAQALNNVCNIPQSQLPKPSRKGDNFAISIPDEEYEMGMEGCKYNLHARILWPKGSTPLTVVALRAKLQPAWKNLGRWGITSIGKGFYEFIFSSIEDANSVRSVGSWNLKPGILKLFAWTHDFNPSLIQNSTAQVWVRIYGLSQEYWRPKILFAIASSVGTPLCTDAVTSKPAMDRTFGHFARVLVDMDLSNDLKYKVLVERKGYAFFVELGYDNLPAFCSNCKITGHNIEKCRKVNEPRKQARQTEKETNEVRNHTEPINVDMEPINVDDDDTQKDKDVQQDMPAESSRQNLEAEIEMEPIICETPKQSYLEGEARQDTEKQVPGDTGEEEQYYSEDSEFVENTPASGKSDQGSSQQNPSQEPIPSQQPNISHTSSQTSNTSKNTSPSQHSQTHNLQTNTPQVTPTRIQQDMNFLQKSWANLEDLQEEVNQQDTLAQQQRSIDQQIAQEIQHNIEDSGFQVVTSRSSKKKNNKKVKPATNTYATRSKVVNPKPI